MYKQGTLVAHAALSCDDPIPFRKDLNLIGKFSNERGKFSPNFTNKPVIPG